MSNIRMLMIAPAPAVRRGENVLLDDKFTSGMTLQSRLFPGDFDCILRESTTGIAFSERVYDREKHDFGLTVLSPNEPITPEHLSGYDVIYCSADDLNNLNIPDIARAVGAKLATTLEYTLATRLRIVALDSTRSVLRRIYGSIKLLLTERKRRKFLASMDAIQANGYPAFEVCKAFDPNTLLFLDNRTTADLFASDDDMSARRDRLMDGRPLSLVYSGRLEPMKGVQDLIPIAADLKNRGVLFSLDIFGQGSLEEEMQSAVLENDLQEQVTFNGTVDFEKVLAPRLRKEADIFLCCHKQADPSCTYIESMGSGLAVVGYDNAMWKALCAESKGGWTSRVGRKSAIVDLIAALDKDRGEIARKCETALKFAKKHDFETLSRRRMEHLAAIA